MMRSDRKKKLSFPYAIPHHVDAGPLMFIVGGNGHACLMAVQSWTLFLKTDFSEVSGTVNHS